MSRPDLQQVAPSLYRLRIRTGPAHLLDCYLWLGADGVTLVGTGWPDNADLIAAALSELGRTRTEVRRIVLTHFHDDHAGSAAEIAAWGSAEVVAGAADAQYVAGTTLGLLPRLTDGEAVLSDAAERIAAAADHFAPAE